MEHVMGAVCITVLALCVTPLAAQQPPRFSTEIVKDLECLSLHVRPRIMLPLTRADIRVELRIRRHAHHRSFLLAWDGGLAGAGSSAQSLHGEDEPALHVRTIRDQVAAPWEFAAAVFDARGAAVSRARATIRYPEPPL